MDDSCLSALLSHGCGAPWTLHGPVHFRQQGRGDCLPHLVQSREAVLASIWYSFSNDSVAGFKPMEIAKTGHKDSEDAACIFPMALQ